MGIREDAARLLKALYDKQKHGETQPQFGGRAKPLGFLVKEFETELALAPKRLAGAIDILKYAGQAETGGGSEPPYAYKFLSITSRGELGVEESLGIDDDQSGPEMKGTPVPVTPPDDAEQAASLVRAARPRRLKYQVFVSATFRDLQTPRERVSWEILKIGHVPVGMENFSAADDRGWNVIKRAIDESDYYVLLVGGRYGSIDAQTGISWTEREYNYAREKGLPVLAFLRKWKLLKHEEVDDEQRVRAFRQKLQDAHLIEEWEEADDLGGRVSVALLKNIAVDEADGKPRPGWFRGPLVEQAALADELAQLSAENRSLRERVQENTPRTLTMLRAAIGRTATVARYTRGGAFAGTENGIIESVDIDANAFRLRDLKASTVSTYSLDRVISAHRDNDLLIVAVEA